MDGIDIVAPYVREIFGKVGMPKEFTNGTILTRRVVEVIDDEKTESKKILMRRATRLAARGTVYGRAHEIQNTQRVHSPSGINIDMVLSTGHYNEEALFDYIKKNIISDLARSQRVNQIMEAVRRCEKYENYTCLLFTMILKYFKILTYNKNTFKMIKHKITRKDYEKYNLIYEEDSYKIVDDIMKQYNIGYTKGSLFQDYHIMRAHFMKGNNDDYIYQFKVWTIDKYDDGHTIIDESRGVDIGFKQRQFKVPEFGTEFRYTTEIKRYSQQYLDVPSEDRIDEYSRQRYKFRVDSMTPLQIIIFTSCLRGNKRNTPLLCDQDIQLVELDQCAIYATNKSTNDALDRFGPTFTRDMVTEEAIRQTINVFVNIHRCYDDFLVALRLAIPYLAQVLPDTIEAHIWLNMQRSTTIPEFGAFRGINSIYTIGTPCQLTKAAADTWFSLEHVWQNMLQASIAHDALWCWAEYLRCVNIRDSVQQMKKLIHGKYVFRDPAVWVPTLLSAMIGKPQPTVIFQGCGIIITRPPDVMFSGMSIIVDKVNEEQTELDKWGWSLVIKNNIKKIFLNQPAPPSGIVLVVGLGGTLLDGTPLSHEFMIERSVRREGVTRLMTITDWYNVWSLGMVTHLNGFDLHYHNHRTGPDNETITTYAANDVQLIVPPVFYIHADNNDWPLYNIISINERKNKFGVDDPTRRMDEGEVRRLRWKTTPAIFANKNDMTAMDACHNIIARPVVASKMIKTVVTDVNYVVGVYAKYDTTEQDFQVEYQMLGELPHIQSERPLPLHVPVNEQHAIIQVDY